MLVIFSSEIGLNVFAETHKKSGVVYATPALNLNSLIYLILNTFSRSVAFKPSSCDSWEEQNSLVTLAWVDNIDFCAST